jgi:hypothetical protein
MECIEYKLTYRFIVNITVGQLVKIKDQEYVITSYDIQEDVLKATLLDKRFNFQPVLRINLNDGSSIVVRLIRRNSTSGYSLNYVHNGKVLKQKGLSISKNIKLEVI